MNVLINETDGIIFEQKLIEEISSVVKLVEFEEGDVLIDIGTYRSYW